MSRVDVREFLVEVARAFPEVRYFNFGQTEAGMLSEVPRDDPEVPDQFGAELSLYFVGPKWEPRIVPQDDKYRPSRLVNRPMPVASISPAMLHVKTIEELGRPITWSTPGLLNANYLRGDSRGKSIIAKLFRLHRKFVGNRIQVVDLLTGERLREERDAFWHGADMARQCLTQNDHYLGIYMDRAKGEFWGELPSEVPGN